MMWLLAWLAGTSGAAVPDGIRPAPAPIDTAAQYAAYLESTGKAADPLACDVLWEGEALLCFKVRQADKVRWVTEKDLKKWKVDLPKLRATVETLALEHLDELAETAVADMEGRKYWTLASADGWAAAPILLPHTAAERLGLPTFLAALPTESVSMFWTTGDAELDKVMAVGAAEMYDNEDGPVTSTVMRWDGQKWLPYAEAEKRRKGPGMPL